jgi:sugar phosphate isomerase/epimerase
VQFGISTRLYRDRPLKPDQLSELAAHGFRAIELFAAPPHADLHDVALIASLPGWLDAGGLRLHSVHVPGAGGRDGRGGSLASADGARRAEAVQEAAAALALAERVPYEFLVVHLGVPEASAGAAGENSPAAARRSVEELHERAAASGVKLALEIIPNRLSSADGLVRLLDELELHDGGVCLDFGHAHLMGDLVEAIESASGHVFTTHVHDNRGAHDEHLVPFEGTIEWGPALFAMQKVGYEGVFMLELAGGAAPAEALRKAQAAQRRLERLFAFE